MPAPDACDIHRCVHAVQADFAGRGFTLTTIADPWIPAFFPCEPGRLSRSLHDLLEAASATQTAATLLIYEADDPTRCVLRFEIKGSSLGFTLGPETDIAPAEITGQALAILVAEDNAANQALVIGYLQHLGHVCDMVGNGLAAVQAAERRLYDLILMDIHMPVLDGIKATRRIRALARGSEPFIAALTAYTLPGHRQECLDAGMNDYLSKPCRLGSLSRVVEKAARHAAARSNF